MKYNININQKSAVELGLKLDEVLLLTCVHDLIPISKFEKNETHEVFITQSIFLEEYPLLNFKERTSFFKKFKNLEEKGFLTKSSINLKGNKKKNYYGLTSKSEQLFYSSTNVEKNHSTNVEKNHSTNVEKNQHNNNNYNNNNYNNKKNIKKEYFENKELNNLFLEFLEFRITLKAKNNERAITLLLNELNKYDDTTKIKMLNKSFMNSWKSVFPLKEEPKKEEVDQSWKKKYYQK